MKNNNVLLKTLLKATGNANILKYSTDAKRKKRARTGVIGKVILYACLLAYAISISIGYGQTGLTEAIPATTVLTIALVSFFFTLFKTNGYLFNFKEYDMLMAMPIPIRKIVADKFAYMYIKSLPIMALTSVSMLVGYGVYARPSVLVYVIWVALSLVIPLIPMVIASAIGALFARIGSGMKHKTLVQTALIVVFTVACICSRFVIEKIFRDGKVDEMMGSIADTMDKAMKYYPPAKWFTRSVVEGSIGFALLFVAVSVALFVLFTAVVSRSYREINSALASGSTHTKYKAQTMKTRSVANAIAFKEFKRLSGSTTCLSNIGMGVVFVTILGVAALFVNADKLISTIMQGVPITSAMLMPAIPAIIYFFIGMVPWTCCAPSLEGKNYWILQSMPVNAMDVYKGKMLFNIYFFGPFMAFGVIALSISARAPFLDAVLYLVCGLVLLIFSTCFGMRCGLKHIRLDWENEIEVVKQGAAVTAYLLPNMFITMGLVALVVVLSIAMSSRVVILILTLIAAVLAGLSYGSVKRIAKKGL